MLLHQTTEDGRNIKYQDVVNTRGNTDYVKNGEVYKNNPSQSVMVSGQSDLAGLTNYGVGTIAYTAGFKKLWQKSASGTWVEV